MSNTAGPENRLDSWKEIAAYLKRGVRTVQRWERSSGLPVHRLELDRQGSVFAYKQELGAWWEDRQQTVAKADAAGVTGSSQTLVRHWVLWTGVSLTLALGSGILLARWLAPRRSAVAALDSIPLTSDLGSEIDPTFSPDGNEVAYAWDGPAQKKWDIYVKAIGSDLPLQVTKGPEPNVNPSWSPDGRSIAFVRFLDQPRKSLLIVMPPIGGQERILSEGMYFGPRPWSPDNRWIVAASPTGVEGPLALTAIGVSTGKNASADQADPRKLGRSGPCRGAGWQQYRVHP
jgi:hypothetical protein